MDDVSAFKKENIVSIVTFKNVLLWTGSPFCDETFVN